jgi:hypothetical protein
MIKIFNSAVPGERFISLDEVNVVEQLINYITGRPEILFEHKDYPLGGLVAEYNGDIWLCDLN